MYKDFPIKELHPQAHLAAEAAECAGEQGGYWSMHATLFAAPSEWDTTEDAARAAFGLYAGKLGLDAARFESCLAEGRYRPDVEANMAEGRRLGVTGTPAFIINGKIMAGAQPVEVFQRVLNRELKQQP